MKTYDAIILGFGKGGKTLAASLARHGETVAVVEASAAMYGGTCINIGCIPTKTLAHLAAEAPAAETPWSDKQAYYAASVQRKNDLTTLLRRKNYDALASQPQIDILTGVGSFTGPDTVAVTTAEGVQELRGTRIIINTGAETVVPPIAGLAQNPYVYTSTTIMELAQLPKHLTIIGGGYIGLEFASMYASFGSKVTVLEGAPALIGREDRDIAATVQQLLEQKGITFRIGVAVQRLEGSRVIFTDRQNEATETLDADAILLAIGRKPRTSELHLDAAGVRTDERGTVLVDEQLRTSNPSVWALGDVKGGLQFTYISLDDFRIVQDGLYGSGRRSTADRSPVAYSVFIDPPLSRIGMGEDEALAKGLHVKVKKLPVAAIPRAHTLQQPAGLFKAIVDANTDRILGCTLLGPASEEVINTVALAIKADLPYTALRDFIFTHPSMSESLNDLFQL